MAANPIPSRFGELMDESKACVDGATALGASIPLVINTAAAINTDRAAALAAQGAYETALAGFESLRSGLAEAEREAREFATVTRDWLENFLGRRWNVGWRAVGFQNNSLSIPRDEAGLATLVERMGPYLAANVAQENAALDVTAARAAAVYEALSQARAEINARRNQCGGLKGTRDAAVEVLGRRLRGLCNELLQRIGRSDPRWRQFGLNIPATQSVPAVPVDVVVNTELPGQLVISCAPSRYATYYRFFTQRLIVDPEPVFAGRAENPLFIVTGLTAGTQYEVFVVASNESADSRFSEPVVGVVTAARAQAA